MTAKHTIPVLNQALKLICSLAESEAPATSKELSQSLGISVSTCYRILQTFTAFDWLRPTPGGRFEFSLGLLPLLKPLSNYQHMFDHLREPLEHLVERTSLMAKVSVKQGGNAVTVFRVESPCMIAPSSKIGAAFPLAYGSSGACLLSGMADAEIQQLLDETVKDAWQWQTQEDVWKRVHETRAARICFDPGSYHPKVQTVSAPILRDGKEVFAALTLIGWPEDFTGEKLHKLKTELLRTVEQCETLFRQK